MWTRVISWKFESHPFSLQTYSRWALHRLSRLRLGSSTASHNEHELSSPAEPTPTGWSPPTGAPAPPGVTPDIPFRVRRSKYHQLPVYSDYKNGRTRILTKISKIDGDIETMERMLRDHLQVENLRCRVDGVTGSIVLNGDHRVEVRKWLKSLGF